MVQHFFCLSGLIPFLFSCDFFLQKRPFMNPRSGMNVMESDDSEGVKDMGDWGGGALGYHARAFIGDTDLSGEFDFLERFSHFTYLVVFVPLEGSGGSVIEEGWAYLA